jgi:hypothetical protein
MITLHNMLLVGAYGVIICVSLFSFIICGRILFEYYGKNRRNQKPECQSQQTPSQPN